MSFTILGPTEDIDLKNALDEATREGIVMLCSLHDEGSKVGKVWPAGHTLLCILVVVGCDEYGRPFRAADTIRYTCMLHGQNVAAGVIPFLEPSDRIIGSSVATALAAGLSSLTLSCDRLADPGRTRIYQEDNRKREDLIKQRFHQMQSIAKSKYVLLEKFAGIDQRIRVGQRVDVEDIEDYLVFSMDWP